MFAIRNSLSIPNNIFYAMRFYVYENEHLTLATYKRNTIYQRINIGLF